MTFPGPTIDEPGTTRRERFVPSAVDWAAIRDAMDHDGLLGDDERDILSSTMPDRDFRELEFEHRVDGPSGIGDRDVYRVGAWS